MLEDLFKVVKDRWGGTHSEDGHAARVTDGHKCTRCGTLVSKQEFEKSRKVCPACNYHARLTWRERLAITADKNSFVEYDKDMRSRNPINFPDYPEKVASLREKCDSNDAIVTGECTILGYRAVIGVMDSHFMMASMGSVVGEKITRAFEQAEKKGLPVILFTASGGARMQEGIISLMQMAKTSGAIARFGKKGGLYITVMTDPTTGGVTASFASLGDIIIAEPRVLIGFAGRRVIQDTIRQQLPDDFQTSEFLQESGFVDMIVERKQMRRNLAKLLMIHRCPKES